jgi:hypothetical protein
MIYNFPQSVGGQVSLTGIDCEQQKRSARDNRRHNRQSPKKDEAASECALLGVRVWPGVHLKSTF